MSFNNSGSELTDRFIVSRYSRCRPVTPVPRARSVSSIIVLMGIRISWLILARNLLVIKLVDCSPFAGTSFAGSFLADNCSRAFTLFANSS